MTINHEQEKEIKSQQEVRKHDRFYIVLNVYNPQGNLLGVTNNISLDGIFIETDKEIKWDEIYMSISIELPENRGILKTDGVAVMAKEGGYGITLFLDDTNKNKLSKFIESLKERGK